uniref:Uncharacterized protein n=1 Tax=Anguilla anguilla TaxID=7936 RepID=A0A0E9SYR2_ANGAN
MCPNVSNVIKLCGNQYFSSQIILNLVLTK